MVEDWEEFKEHTEQYYGLSEQELGEKRKETLDQFIAMVAAPMVEAGMHKQFQNKTEFALRMKMATIDGILDSILPGTSMETATLWMKLKQEQEEQFSDIPEDELENILGLNIAQEENRKDTEEGEDL